MASMDETQSTTGCSRGRLRMKKLKRSFLLEDHHHTQRRNGWDNFLCCRSSYRLIKSKQIYSLVLCWIFLCHPLHHHHGHYILDRLIAWSDLSLGSRRRTFKPLESPQWNNFSSLIISWRQTHDIIVILSDTVGPFSMGKSLFTQRVPTHPKVLLLPLYLCSWHQSNAYPLTSVFGAKIGVSFKNRKTKT